MNHDEVKKILSSKNSERIIDFVLNHHFKDNHDELYLNFLLKFEYTKRNSLLASYVIDIACYKKLKNSVLVELYKKLICIKLNYLVKLSILDYFNDLNIKLSQSEIKQFQKLNRYSYRTLRLQFLLSNIFYNHDIEQNIDFVLMKLRNRDCSHIEIIRVLNVLNYKKVNKAIKPILIKNNSLKLLKDELVFYNSKFASINSRFDKYITLY